MPVSPVHRVVTGHDASGKAVFVSNGVPPTVVETAALPGMVFHEIWETHGSPAPVDSGPEVTLGPLVHHAPPSGTRIRILDFPPDVSYVDEAETRVPALFKEVRGEEALTTTPTSPHPMMHRSEAVDYGIVLEGELVLMLDDSEVALRPGSIVVQRGTNHAWANRSNKPARMVFIQIDGKYEASLAALLARGSEGRQQLRRDAKIARGEALAELAVDGE